MKKIEILPIVANSFKIVQGFHTTSLLDRFTKLNTNERQNLVRETIKILSNCNNPTNDIANAKSTSGIVIGYVQSGKTMSFTTLTALAIDNGFRIIIYFAGIKNNLLEQTTKRLKKDLLTDSENARSFKVYQSPTLDENVHLKIKGALGLQHKPAILITVLKHYKHIKELTDIFNTYDVKEALGNSGVMIIDDEADQASLNTYARKNSKSEDWEDDEYSSTYSSILQLKDAIPNHSYLQYTATPQAPLLINILDLLSPKFHVVLTPGDGYTGGKIFFKENTDLILKIPDQEVYHHKNNKLTDCPQSLIDALQLFLMGVAVVVNIQGKENFLSMLIHADREQDASRIFHKWVKDLLDNWQERLNKLKTNDPSRQELVAEFMNLYPEATKLIENPPSFDEVINSVVQVTLDYNIELVISKSSTGKQKKTSEIDWSNASAHILVGAEMLNRGYTVEGLAVSYMPRNTISKSNADTIQQRCRFFGYKQQYLASCRVFLPGTAINEYVEYVEHEEILRAELKTKSLEECEQLLILSSIMNPTRNNILSVDLVKNKMSGWRQFNALQHIEENTYFMTRFLSEHHFTNFKDYGTNDRNHRYIKLEIDSIIEFLRDFKIANMPDALRKSSTIQYLRYLKDNREVKYGYIFEMAYAVDKGRERALIQENSSYKISNIFSGRSTSGSQTYVGDREILFKDFLCIQIHKIRLKHDSMKWGNKVVYTLGVYYPEELSHSFVGIAKI
ncbi:Z1 domain-containing protein [Pedobacter frigoris]|uniref:Z1 domain-containing protein n=1 Tax=Pedobacter frigoris TaxID=2571272 RepID=UPI00292EE0D7|nr:Z1 domain-containing protein [Pedobacter frigoris]